MVRLTERAAEHVLALMREDPEALALRVAVQGGGCSGLQYALGFDGEPQPGDEVVDQHGVKVVVDRFSLPYLSGAEVDFVDGLMGQGFTVNNPNAVASCGCGSSFKAGGRRGRRGRRRLQHLLRLSRARRLSPRCGACTPRVRGVGGVSTWSSAAWTSPSRPRATSR